MLVNQEERSSNKIKTPEDRRFWSKEEHSLMVEFLNGKRDEMIKHINDNLANDQRKNKSQFFIEMARHIGTKDKSQCKSRFQKRETELINMLELPKNLLKAYFADKEKKKRAYTDKRNKERRERGEPVKDDSNKVINTEPETLIQNYDDLKKALSIRIMPKIAGDNMRDIMLEFISKLPVDNGFKHLSFKPMISCELPRPPKISEKVQTIRINKKIAKPPRRLGFVKFMPNGISKID